MLDFLYQGDHDVEEAPFEDHDEDDEDDEVDENTEVFVLNTVVDEVVPEFDPHVGPTIKKVRACARKFRKSPKINDILQSTNKALQASLGVTVREVTLVLDCRTRWNSMPAMFDSLATCQEALESLREMMPDVIPTAAEFKIMNQLRLALKPVQVLTLKLCKENVDILEADSHFTTTFKLLENQNSAIADRLKDCIYTR